MTCRVQLLLERRSAMRALVLGRSSASSSLGFIVRRSRALGLFPTLIHLWVTASARRDRTVTCTRGKSRPIPLSLVFGLIRAREGAAAPCQPDDWKFSNFLQMRPCVAAVRAASRASWLELGRRALESLMDVALHIWGNTGGFYSKPAGESGRRCK